MTTLLIGINYRTEAHAVMFARNLKRYSLEDVSVILVDNSESGDPDAFSRQIQEANPQIRCLEAPRNLGYFGGAQYGLKQYLASSEWPVWVIVCNVDIEFRDPQFFATLRQLEGFDSLGVVAPCIWSTRYKRDLNPKISRRPSKKRMYFYKIIFGNYFLQTVYEILSFVKNRLRAGVREKPTDDQGQQKASVAIYAAHGSCMIFSRRYFAAGGSLEYSAFLFGEEIFVAETAKRLGLAISHCPGLYVLDHEHASTGIIRSRTIARYMKDATNYLVEHYFA